MRYRLALPLAFIVLLMTAHAGAAQTCARLNTIVGKLVDAETGAPVVGARVDIVDRNCNTAGPRPVHSDSSGAFRIQFRFDDARIEITAPGYQRSNDRSVRFRPGFSTEVMAIFMRPETKGREPVYKLEGLEVVTSPARRSPVLEAFDARVASGRGWYFTRSDIEARKPARVSDLLTSIPGITLVSRGPGNQREVVFGRHASQFNACSAQIFLNGQLVNKPAPRSTRGRASSQPTMTIDDVVAPGDLEGIEVYYGLSTIPPEFLNEEARCGVVALWTRRGQ